MIIRLYIDEDSMSRALVRALEARGINVTTALAEGMIERPTPVPSLLNLSGLMQLHR